MKKLLVTGANGFIGKSVLPILAAQHLYEVHAVTAHSRSSLPDICSWHVADLLKPHQVQDLVHAVRPTHLLHLAWYTAHGDYWTSTENYRWLQASQELLRLFHSNGGQRVVMAGTCAEYDWRAGLCCETTTPLCPHSVYGTCKRDLFCWLDDFSHQTGLSMAWARIFFLYGPHEAPQRLVPSVIAALLRNEPPRLTGTARMRDFLYVEDVADALACLLAGRVPGPVNIASGQPVAIGKLLETIADKLHRRNLVQLSAPTEKTDEPPMLVADVRRLTHECGWLPRFHLHSGLERTIDWWRSQNRTAHE